jgi:hypothetical protein
MQTKSDLTPEPENTPIARAGATVARTPIDAVLGVQRGAGNQAAVRMLTRDPDGATATDPDSATDTDAPDTATDDKAADDLRNASDAGMGERISITDDLLSLLAGGNRSEPSTLSKHKGNARTDIKGQVTAGGAKVDDVKQGALGDCYLLAALAAVAKANPALIEQMVKDNGDGTYDVTIYKDKGWFKKDLQPTVVKVTSSFPTDAAGNPIYAQKGSTDAKGPALWVMLIEKAYAQSKGGYNKIEGGFGAPALEAITGKASTKYTVSDYDETTIVNTLDNLINHMGYAVTAGADWAWFKSTEEKAKKDVGAILNHEYTVVGVNVAANTIDLRNPWGEENLTALPVAKFKQYFIDFSGNPTK